MRLIECKAAHTVMPSDAGPMQRLAVAMRKARPRGLRVEQHLVHLPPQRPLPTGGIAPQVKAWIWPEFVNQL